MPLPVDEYLRLTLETRSVLLTCVHRASTRPLNGSEARCVRNKLRVQRHTIPALPSHEFWFGFARLRLRVPTTFALGAGLLRGTHRRTWPLRTVIYVLCGR